MIRFVDVRYQGLMARFSFWNTVRDRYLEFSGEQAWDTWDHFMEAFDDDTYNLPRLKSKCPEWVFQEPTDEELDFRETEEEPICPFCSKLLASGGVKDHVKVKHPDDFLDWIKLGQPRRIDPEEWNSARESR